MPGKDESLLARLNALKPSSVNLNTTPAIDVEVSKPVAVDDKLSERLKRLRAGETVTRDNVRIVTTATTQSVRSYELQDDTSLHDWQQDGNEQSIDDLLAELRSNEQTSLDPNDPEDIKKLMQEARAALPPSESPDEVNEAQKSEHESEEEFGDEKAADQYVQQVLAELDIEQRYGVEPPDEEPVHSDIELPATSSTSLVHNPPSYEDSELEARFSKLAMGLPSTPISKPAVKIDQKATTKSKSSLPKFTDEDIDSWCCICNEDGELRCLGCDDDIYCQSCWDEGHGRGPGQEQGHKAVLYSRKGGGLAAAD